MFIQQIGTQELNVILDSVPKFEEEQLDYFRREKEYYISVVVKKGIIKEMQMNAIAWELLQLCNGKKRLSNVLEEYTNRNLNIDQNADYLNDVIKTLWLCDSMWLLSWGKEGSPFMFGTVISLGEEYTLTWAKENAIRDIAAAYDNYLGDSDYYLHNCPENRLKGLTEYFQEESLRSKLFFYNEDFFILRDKEGNIVGIISVSNNNPDTNVLEISTMIVPVNMIEMVLKGLQKMLVENYIFELSKLRIKTISNEESKMNEVCYENCGFCKSAILKAEYGKGNDLTIYDYFFERVNENESCE